MKNLGKRFPMLVAAIIMAIGFAAVPEPSSAQPAQDYSAYGPQAALDAKLGELDAELARRYPDRRKIESLSREIGALRGEILATNAGERRLAPRGPEMTDGYYAPNRGYRHHGYQNSWHHGGGYGGHHGGRGCWW